jgi:hypothetical protein
VPLLAYTYTALCNGSHCSEENIISSRSECPSDLVNGAFRTLWTNCLCPRLGICLAFLVRGPRTGTYGKVPASIGHHLTSFATWGTWLLLPKLAKRNVDAGGSHPAVVPRAFGHGYASIEAFAVNPRTTSLPEHRITASRF